MRTHKIIFTCNSVECANWYANEILHIDFCDFTHWYCGLDHAGEDTPEYCLIYQGIIHPEIITVEFDANAMFGKSVDIGIENLKKQYHEFKLSKDKFEIFDVKFEELDAYTKVKQLSDELSHIKSNLTALFES